MKVKSIKIKLWLYFALFTAIIFSVLWVLQTVFLQGFYNQMLIYNTKSAAEKIVKNSSKDNISEVIDEIARGNTLLVFITDEKGNVLYISDEYKNAHKYGENEAQKEGFGEAQGQREDFGKKQKHLGYRSLPENYNSFLDSLKSSESGVTEYSTDSLYVYGAYIDYNGAEGKSVLYVSTTLDAVGSTVTIIRIQLAIVTAFSLVIGFVLAWFIAKKFAKPVSQLSDKAKALGDEGQTSRFKKGFCSELDELNSTLDETSEKLRRSKSFQNELLANVSHDLRTPLTMIKGYAESISDMGDDEEQRKADAAIIIREADRLTDLVNEIIEYSELQSEGRADDFVAVDFGRLVNKVADSFESLYKREGGTIEREINENIVINGNSGRLERAVYNLIDNAVRHTGDSKKITVTLSKEGGKAVLRVIDYGKGIPAEELDVIWDRYYTSRKRGGKGASGLGLAIVKQITALHGGRCYAQSKQGEGSVFVIELESD